MTNYNIKAKGAEGKFVTLGNVKPGKNGGFQVGIRATEVTAQVINSLMARDGEWVNLSIFEADEDGNAGGYRRSNGDAPF